MLGCTISRNVRNRWRTRRVRDGGFRSLNTPIKPRSSARSTRRAPPRIACDNRGQDESLDESDHTLGMVDRSNADPIGTVVAGYYRDLCRSCITDLADLLIPSLPEKLAGGAAMVLDLCRRLIQSVRYRVDSRAESRWDSQWNISCRC